MTNITLTPLPLQLHRYFPDLFVIKYIFKCIGIDEYVLKNRLYNATVHNLSTSRIRKSVENDEVI